jgi:Domain of unknown function DUF29
VGPQPERRGSSWEDSIIAGRNEIADGLSESPSLRPHLPDLVSKHYTRARRRAAVQTQLEEDTFPRECPYTLEQILGD